MSNTITTPAPPNTSSIAAQAVAWISGQSGVLTDFNAGSQVRTLFEAFGSVEEIQSYTAQAQAFQALVYSAYQAYGITPLTAQYATGQVTFLTGTGSSPPAAAQSVSIPQGTIVQTIGGTQFTTTQSVVLAQGSSSVTAPVIASIGGTNGNVSASTITQIVTGLPYALFCTNTAATKGGQAAESAAQTLARFTAAVAATGLGTPVAIANAAVGVSVSGTGETAKYSTVYEPWVAQVLASGTPTAGYNVYVDNGSGSASADLLTAVETKLDGILNTSTLGYRPAGVPYAVSGVVPVYSTVTVSGTLANGASRTTETTAVESALSTYYDSLAFAEPAEEPELVAAVANAVSSNVSSLAVYLINVSGTAVSGISASYNERNILQSYTINFA